MAAKIYITMWGKTKNTNYCKCYKILYEVADEYLEKALDKLDDYLAKGYTHLRVCTIEKIKGFYSRPILRRNVSKIEYEIVPSKHLHLSYVFEINSLKEWLKKKYQDAKNEAKEKYPAIVYEISERRCKELGVI